MASENPDDVVVSPESSNGTEEELESKLENDEAEGSKGSLSPRGRSFDYMQRAEEQSNVLNEAAAFSESKLISLMSHIYQLRARGPVLNEAAPSSSANTSQKSGSGGDCSDEEGSSDEEADLMDQDEEDLESKLISLISQLRSLDLISEILRLIIKIISLVRSMDLDSQPKPESRLISLITQAVSLFNAMDFDSLPQPLSELISFLSQQISIDSDQTLELNSPQSQKSLESLVGKTLELKPAPELISLIRQIVYVTISMDSKTKKLISLSPQVQVRLDEGKFHVDGEVSLYSAYNFIVWTCFFGNLEEFGLTGEDATHFHCESCNGEYHKENEKAPLEIKHPIHPKHSLQLVWFDLDGETRECYCCDEDLKRVFYYCSTCDLAMNVACVEKAPVLARDHPKWHEHTLALFPSQTSLPCNVCALTRTTCPFYICPPCDFVVHQRCISLPRLIRISRHPHRMSFTPSFNLGDCFCGVCRRNINNDYGGYSCIKDGCSYAAHSRCATQRNVWDGLDLEGEPEEIEEEVVEPFVRISDGIIRHFSHDHHHLRLDENTSRDYDENMLCQVCITPIYFGNLYSCVQCKFVLHETCANLSRKLFHPIHPHRLTLAPVKECGKCSACRRRFTCGFLYECGKKECDFQLHVQCAKIAEPLVHESHEHPLFLTSKPGERRLCRVCQRHKYFGSSETFNCIECDDFALCFKCATLPPKVRYKHDKHILTLSYGEETSIVTYWCEACERKIDPKKRFYMCDEYCCVTLHIECLIGKDLYTKPGSWWYNSRERIDVLRNDHHMSRPICSECKKRCPQKIVFQRLGYKDILYPICSVHCGKKYYFLF